MTKRTIRRKGCHRCFDPVCRTLYEVDRDIFSTGKMGEFITTDVQLLRLADRHPELRANIHAALAVARTAEFRANIHNEKEKP